MKQTVRIIETSLRDGQQSLWATRMTTAMMLPVLPLLDALGFEAIEYTSAAAMEVCIRHLKENPWERMRLVRQQVKQTPLGMICAPVFSVSSKGLLPDDLLELYLKTCARNGIHSFFLLDGLNDMRNLEVPIRAVKEAGERALPSITYSISPVHTDEHFASKVADLKRFGADAIVLKDPSGILTPERVRTLVPALRRAGEGMPVYCHSHCSTGLGPANNLEAVTSGATGIWTVAEPLANGSSLPNTESMVRHLRRMGHSVEFDDHKLRQVAEHFHRVAVRHGKPLGRPAEYDPVCYIHQMPGGMVSNFLAQLAQLGIQDRFEQVLEEIPAVRSDLGWAIMVTPFSQIIATQAAMNVLYGRYKVILGEVKMLLLGWYGETPSPVDANLVDRVSDGAERINARPGAVTPPALDRIRASHGDFRSDEELLLNAFFMPEALKAMYDSGPIRLDDLTAEHSLVGLVREVAKNKGITRFRWIN